MGGENSRRFSTFEFPSTLVALALSLSVPSTDPAHNAPHDIMPTTDAMLCAAAAGLLVSLLGMYNGFLVSTPMHHVSICNRFGNVFNRTYPPGLHVKDPFTGCHHLFVQEQVDSVQDVHCGTVDGIQLVFPRIDVHNLLPARKAHSVFLRFSDQYDKLLVFKLVQFFVGQQCATRTAEEIFLTGFNDLDEGLTADLTDYQTEKDTGLIILKTKYYKPTAKNSNILGEFAKRAEAKAKRKALLAQEDTIRQENANALKVAKGVNDLAAAKAAAEQDVITEALKAELLRKQKAVEAQRKEAQIKNLIELEQAENKASVRVKQARAELEATELVAKGNEKLLTEAYRDLRRSDALARMNKAYYGANIGDVFRLLGGDTPPGSKKNVPTSGLEPESLG